MSTLPVLPVPAAFTVSDMAKLRVTTMLQHAFFGSLGLRLTPVADESVETLSVDGVTLWYAPSFMAALPLAQRIGVIVHEVGHCALLHLWRCGNRDMRRWNRACDFVLNLMLVDAGIQLPLQKLTIGSRVFGGALLDRRFAGMSAEQVYAILTVEDEQQQEQGDGKTDGGKGDAGDGATGTNTSSDGAGSDQSGGDGSGQQKHANNVRKSETGDGGTEQGGAGADDSIATGAFKQGRVDGEGATPCDMNEADWQIFVEQAVAISRKAGTLPGGWAEVIAKTHEPRIDWRGVLEQFIVRTTMSDYRWTSPSRRLISRKLYLPGPYKENVGPMVFAIDSSASVTTKMLQDFVSETVGALSAARPERVYIVYCDTRVAAVDIVEPDDYGDIKFDVKGRGGTKFQPVFDWVEAEGIDPVCLVYLTDLDNSDTVTAPPYPVLWAVPEQVSKRGLFGETLQIGAA